MSVNIYDPNTKTLIPLAGNPSPDPVDGALYWIGKTETAITDGSSVSPIVIATYEEVTPEAGDNPSEEGWYEVDSTTISGYKVSEDTSVISGKKYYARTTQNIIPSLGGVTQYNSEEFIWDSHKWQSFANANLGALAYANSVEATYQPAGTVSVTESPDTTISITPFGSAGSSPYFTIDGEAAVFNPGTLASPGESVNVVTASGTRTATFSGTSATIESTAQ